MKVIQVSDELYDRLKSCVVDPFDDTPESVIGRLIEIVDKAKSRWSPLDAHLENGQPSAGEANSQNPERVGERSPHWKERAEVVL